MKNESHTFKFGGGDDDDGCLEDDYSEDSDADSGAVN